MKSDSIIQDCHCFVNPFLGGICGFFGGRGAPASGGGFFPSLSPAAPAFRLLFCPYPPAPLPSGKGETKVILCKGLRPLHPRGLNPGGTGEGRRLTRRRGAEAGCYNKFEESSGGSGGLFQESPGASLPPSPRPALAERSSQREGGDFWFISPGAGAPGTPALNRLRH